MATPDVLADPLRDATGPVFARLGRVLTRCLLIGACVLVGAAGQAAVSSIDRPAPEPRLLATAGHDLAPPFHRVGHPAAVAVHNVGAEPVTLLAARISGAGLRQRSVDLPRVPIAAGATGLVQLELGGCVAGVGAAAPRMTVWARSADGAVHRARLELADLNPSLAALRDRLCSS
jgi:hypothetical protein